MPMMSLDYQINTLFNKSFVYYSYHHKTRTVLNFSNPFLLSHGRYSRLSPRSVLRVIFFAQDLVWEPSLGLLRLIFISSCFAFYIRISFWSYILLSSFSYAWHYEQRIQHRRNAFWIVSHRISVYGDNEH